jgi:hypothetical protein
LQARQDDEPVDPPLPACIPPCGPGCAGPYLSDTPAGELTTKRHLSTSDISKREFDLVFAGAEVHALNSQDLFERNFFRVTAGNIDTWMANKVKDSNSGTVQLVYEENSALLLGSMVTRTNGALQVTRRRRLDKNRSAMPSTKLAPAD